MKAKGKMESNGLKYFKNQPKMRKKESDRVFKYQCQICEFCDLIFVIQNDEVKFET